MSGSLLSFYRFDDALLESADDAQFACSLVVVEWKNRALFGFNVSRGQWELPGGSVEPDESARDAAIRELKEETGIRSDRVTIIGRAEIALGNDATRYLAAVFTLALDRAPDLVESDELNEFRWWSAMSEIWEGMSTIDAELVRRVTQDRPQLAFEQVPEVVLRHFRPDDAVTHLRGEDEATSRWLSGGVSNEESVLHWIQSNEENWSNEGPRFAFAIETPLGELAGVIEVNVDYSHFAGLEPGDANVSYGLYAQHRGRGLATSSLLTVRDFMISKGVQRAVIRAEPDNVDSIRLAERCGYVRTGKVMNDAGTEFLVFVEDLQ